MHIYKIKRNHLSNFFSYKCGNYFIPTRGHKIISKLHNYHDILCHFYLLPRFKSKTTKKIKFAWKGKNYFSVRQRITD